MKDLIQKIICEKEIYLILDEKRTNYHFYFVLNNGQKVEFTPYYSNFKDESKNYNTFGDIYKFLVDEVSVNDKTKKKVNPKNEK